MVVARGAPRGGCRGAEEVGSIDIDGLRRSLSPVTTRAHCAASIIFLCWNRRSGGIFCFEALPRLPFFGIEGQGAFDGVGYFIHGDDASCMIA